MALRKFEPNQAEKILLRGAVERASNEFIELINQGKAIKCAEYYEDTAIIRCRPLGMFVGIESIQEFWKQFITENSGPLRYLHPMIECIDNQSAALSCYWRSENSRGEVFQELWGLQPDNSVKILQSEISIFPAQ